MSKSNEDSFHQVDKWISDVKQERGTDFVIMLVGNKTDLGEKRKVSIDDGQAKAEGLGVMFIETSAKAGYNVKNLFRRVATALPGMTAGQESQEATDSRFKVKDAMTENQPSQSSDEESRCPC